MVLNDKNPSASYPAKGFVIWFILFCHLLSVFLSVVYVEILISLGDEVILPHLLESVTSSLISKSAPVISNTFLAEVLVKYMSFPSL